MECKFRQTHAPRRYGANETEQEREAKRASENENEMGNESVECILCVNSAVCITVTFRRFRDFTSILVTYCGFDMRRGPKQKETPAHLSKYMQMRFWLNDFDGTKRERERERER